MARQLGFFDLSGFADTIIIPELSMGPLNSQGVAERFAGLEADVAEGLKVRHDHGPAYLSDDFQREIAYLGMTSSPSFVRAPEGNGYCEWFIRILKENLLWVRSFATVEELRWALLEFKNLYNHHWILEGYGYRTPAQARQEKLAQVAEAARGRIPSPECPITQGRSSSFPQSLGIN